MHDHDDNNIMYLTDYDDKSTHHTFPQIKVKICKTKKYKFIILLAYQRALDGRAQFVFLISNDNFDDSDNRYVFINKNAQEMKKIIGSTMTTSILENHDIIKVMSKAVKTGGNEEFEQKIK